jgi:hypothetical protein
MKPAVNLCCYKLDPLQICFDPNSFLFEFVLIRVSIVADEEN